MTRHGMDYGYLVRRFLVKRCAPCTVFLSIFIFVRCKQMPCKIRYGQTDMNTCYRCANNDEKSSY